MGFWATFTGWLPRRKRAAEPPAIEDGIALPAHGWGGVRRGTAELIAAYRTDPWLRAVTSRIGEGVASVGWTMYARAAEPMEPGRTRTFLRHTPDGTVRDVRAAGAWRWGQDRSVRDLVLSHGDVRSRARRRVELAQAGLLREVPDHPLLEMLQHPNLELTGRACLKVSQVWRDIKGEAFWLLAVDEGGVPRGYFPVPPHWVEKTPTQESPTYRISVGAMQIEVKREAMVWFRDPDPSNPYGRGTGVAESLGDELETDEAAAKYIKGWFTNNAMPSFIVSFEGASEVELKRAREKWEREHRGYRNAHRAHFSSGKMNALRLDASFRDQQIADMRRLSRDFIAQVFAVPPELIGIIENSNRATITAARYIYALGVEFPRVESMRTELQHQLVPRYGGDAVLEAEVPVPDDEQHRLDVMRALPGAFAVNEWRGEAGYEPLPQFDGLFPPLALPGQQEEPAGKDEPAEEPPAPAVDDDDEDRAVRRLVARSDPAWVAQLPAKNGAGIV